MPNLEIFQNVFMSHNSEFFFQKSHNSESLKTRQYNGYLSRNGGLCTP
jgi:hypothetical protein